MSSGFDPYHKWLGIPPAEQPAHHYRLLAIQVFEDDPDVIESAADRQMAHLRTFQAGKNSALSQKLLNEVAAAKVCLLRPEKKAEYDAHLRELLHRQSAGEDTSSQLQALGALDQMIADESARPVSQRRKAASNVKPLVLIGVAVVVIAGIVGWTMMARNRPDVASKTESGKPKAEDSPHAIAGLPRTVASPPQLSSNAESGSSADPAQPKAEEEKTSAPAMPSQDPRPKPQDLPPAESGSSTKRTQPKAEEQPKPAPMPSASAVTPQPLVSSPPPAVPSKLPVPSAADQETAKKQAQDVFRADYEKAKKPSERAELARLILKKGLDTREPPAEHFALLSLARDVAIAADDDKLAYEAINEIAKSFEVDLVSLKADALTTLARSSRSTAMHKTLCERSLALGQEALEQDKLDLADVLAKLASSEASKVRDKDLVQRSRALAKDQQEAAKAFAAVQDTFKTLQEKPDNSAANLAVGKYLCFTKGDWDKGLPCLAKGDDARLKALAEEDLKHASPITLNLPDAWWDLAQSASGRSREGMLLRAGYWYQQIDELDSPLILTKVEKRLETIRRLGRPIPPIPESAVKKTFVNSVGMKFQYIPSGEFDMGVTEEQLKFLLEEAEKAVPAALKVGIGNANELRAHRPQHRVRITRPFYLGVHEVTQSQFQQMMGCNPSFFAAARGGGAKMEGQDTSRRPVDSVTWEEAVQFCQHLSAIPKERLARRVYRLPTEAEWEYACRAGTKSLYYFGETRQDRNRYAWMAIGSAGPTHPVGQKEPNAWGLYDMHGNVAEWCADWFDSEYYKNSPATDPPGPASGSQRIQRGGSVESWWFVATSTYRWHASPTTRGYFMGFRVVCTRE